MKAHHEVPVLLLLAKIRKRLKLLMPLYGRFRSHVSEISCHFACCGRVSGLERRLEQGFLDTCDASEGCTFVRRMASDTGFGTADSHDGG